MDPDMDKDLPHVSAANFKTNCLRLMDEVAQRRMPLIITKRGKPIAKLVPLDDKPIDIFGRMAGTIKICGDIIEPTGEVWEADAGDV